MTRRTGARRTGGSRGSNLFAIDHDAILDTLRDANAALLRRCAALVEALGRLPATLDTAEQVERACIFARQLRAAAEEARAARLGDGRPFRDAVEVVKAFFDEVEIPLRRAEQEVRRRLTEAALRAHPPAPPEPVRPIGEAVTGVTVVGVVPPGAQPPAGSQLPLVWEIADFDRDSLDLEALRPFLTDAMLKTACRKHLEQHGPHTLRGARYRQVAAPG